MIDERAFEEIVIRGRNRAYRAAKNALAALKMASVRPFVGDCTVADDGTVSFHVDLLDSVGQPLPGDPSAVAFASGADGPYAIAFK